MGIGLHELWQYSQVHARRSESSDRRIGPRYLRMGAMVVTGPLRKIRPSHLTFIWLLPLCVKYILP